MIFNFFHTFSSISRDMKIVTLNEIHRYIQNFMLYKMIYFSSHKFAFSNLRFSPFYEHFRQLREKYGFKLKIKYIMSISSLSRIWWCAYIWLFLKKTTPLHSTPLHSTPLHSTPLHSTHSTELFKILFSLLTLSTAFLQKASGPGKNGLKLVLQWRDDSNTILAWNITFIFYKMVGYGQQHRLSYY